MQVDAVSDPMSIVGLKVAQRSQQLAAQVVSQTLENTKQSMQAAAQAPARPGGVDIKV